MDEDELKEKCVYFMEDKHQDELFEVLELDVDEMENVEVGNENNESYQEEIVHVNSPIKCETIASKIYTNYFLYRHRH